MLNGNFIELSNVNKEAFRLGQGIDTGILETELNHHTRVREIFGGKPSQITDQIIYESYVPFFYTGKGNIDKNKIREIVNRYPDVKDPSAMIVNSFNELVEHAIFGFEVAFFHYIVGQKHIEAENFPEDCCGISSRNVQISLIKHGYPNAAYFYSKRYDHGYDALPFVMPSEGINGIIGIDPTSNQFWYSKNKRNHVFVKLGLDWEYRIEEHSAPNMFPDFINSIDTLKKNYDDITNLKKYHKGGREFLEKAYANPIELNLEKSN